MAIDCTVMDVQAFNSVFGYLVGFWGLAVAIALLGHSQYRSNKHGRTALVCLVMSAAFILRAFWQEETGSVYEASSTQLSNLHYLNFVYLIFLNFLSRFYFNSKSFRFTYEWRRIVFYALASLFITGVLTVGGVALLVGSQYWLTATLIFICAIVISSTQLLFQHVNTKSEIDQLVEAGRKIRSIR